MPLGVGQKIAMLRELCGSGRSDVELENLLKETRYDFNRAVEQLLDQSEQSPDQSGDQPCSPLPAEMRRGDDCATQSQKRHRSTSRPDHPSTEQPACTPVQQSTEQQSTEQLQQMNALMRALGEAVITPITKLISALPAQFAAAVRKHDEDEAVRLAAAAQATPPRPAPPHPIPSHLIPSHPISSHPTPSHPIPSHPIPSHPIPSHPIPPHPYPIAFRFRFSLFVFHLTPPRPTPPHPISSHPIPSHLIPSYSIPSHPILSHTIPYHPNPSHPAQETHLERQIGRCASCTEIGKLEGFDFDATHNKIYCLDCNHWGYKAPTVHTRGASSWGVYSGPHASNALLGIKVRPQPIPPLLVARLLAARAAFRSRQSFPARECTKITRSALACVLERLVCDFFTNLPL